ncbi:MAG TPA: Xaa-Pro peptidase family protein, partial [Blastocatellia bacterium]|nr:Xaa-Pro peptidase family protein [Blastocatellia bacterium]
TLALSLNTNADTVIQDAPVNPMASQARPITADEYLQRQETARRFMRESAIDAIFLTAGTTMQYFTGTQWGLSERMFALVFPAKGELAWVTPAFEKGRALEQIKFGRDVRTWEEDQSPYQLVASILRDRGVASGKLGIEETVRFVFSDGVAKAAPALKLTAADPVTARCRRVKSAHEIELMRLANRITMKAFEIAAKSLRDGITHGEFGGKISAAHQQLGARGGALVLFAEYSALPHGTITPQKLKQGDVVLMDGGCSVEGYASDITRTTVFGRPSDKQRRVWDIVKQAQAAALKAARPGVACEDVDAAARKVIVEAGFGPHYKYFTHRVGHGIGMDGHEWTYLVRGNKTKLEAGMTFSNEPGIYIPGEFGVRHEDIMAITQDGAELLTGQAPSIEHPFA